MNKQHIILIFVVGIVLISCKRKEEKIPVTPLEKAQYSVQHYLSEGEHAIPKYTSVSFGTLDSTFSTMPTDSTSIWMDKAEMYGDMAMEYLAKDLKKTNMYADSSTYYSKKVQEYIRNYVPEFTGWAILHTYTAGSETGMQVRVELDTAYQVKKVTPIK